MLALVLSGGANYGAMQAGALEVLLQAGIRPMMIVGTSAGAINAVHIAANPTLDGACQLSDHWRSFAQKGYDKVRPANVLRWLTKGSFFPNEPLLDFLAQHAPMSQPEPIAQTFGQLAASSGVRAYTTAVCLETGELMVFGDRNDDLLADGVMSSTAFYPFLPPWRVDDKNYLDGGLAATLPIRVAVERGASEIIALDINTVTWDLKGASSIPKVGIHALTLAMKHQKKSEIAWAAAAKMRLRIIDLPAPKEVPIWDYQQADYLIELGRSLATKALEAEPLVIHRSQVVKILGGALARLSKR